MHRLLSLSSALVLLLICCVAAAQPLREVRRIDLPQASGRIDHMAFDPSSARVYVAALGSDAVEVVDMDAGRVIGELTGLREPQGVLALPGSKRVLVTNGDAEYASVFDAATLQSLTRIALPWDSDNVRLEANTGRVWIGCGSRRGSALLVVDPATDEATRSIPLPAHPESFQLERSGERIFVNVPAARAVLVLSRATGRTVSRWPLPGLDNFPMALDEAQGRLLIGTRAPARLMVLDTTSGALLAQVPTVRDADDIFVDEQTQRLYVAGGEGYVEAFAREQGDEYRSLQRFATRPGARTALFLPERRLLLVALPRRGASPAQILVLSTEP